MFDWLGVDRNPRSGRELDIHALRSPGRPADGFAVDEKQITVDGEKKRFYTAMDTDSKLLLDIEVFSRHGTDPVSFTETVPVQHIRTRSVLRTVFLHRLTTTHESSDAEFLVDTGGNPIALVWRELNEYPDYSERDPIEELFRGTTMVA